MKKIDKNELFRILQDWNFWNKDMDTGVPRLFYVEKLYQTHTSEQVILVTGARRSGKSFLMRQLAERWMRDGVAKNRMLVVNFEDPRFVSLDTELLQTIYETYQEFLAPSDIPYLFLDEVQEVKRWEKWVRTMQELGKARIVVSGSNAKLLSRELATLLTGRHRDLTVYPLSFKEFLTFRGLSVDSEAARLSQKTEIYAALRQYFLFGGFPGLFKEAEKEKYLLSYFDDLVEKDLIRRYHVRKTEKLKSLLKFYMSNVSTLTTFNATSKFLGVSSDTVEKFSGYFEQAFLIFFLKRFSFKVKEQEKSPRKVYAVDPGLSNTVGFQVGERQGRIAENIVFLEYLRRQVADPRLELFYWKNEYHHEVDFVVKRNNIILDLVQVCWDVNNPTTRQRELRSLIKAMEVLGVSQGTILTEDEENEEKVKGKTIRYMPLWQWLLAEE